MKLRPVTVVLLLMLQLVPGQGIFIYDQQSADEAGLVEGASWIQNSQPLGQSFTPTQSSVGFIRVFVYDANPADGLGGTLFLNLRQSSFNGSVIDSTAPVPMGNGSGGFINFYFNSPVVLTPGLTYFFQPVVLESAATPFSISKGAYSYSGGGAFVSGQPDAFGHDLWFREGVVVPEPSSAWLLLMGCGVFLFSPHTTPSPALHSITSGQGRFAPLTSDGASSLSEGSRTPRSRVEIISQPSSLAPLYETFLNEKLFHQHSHSPTREPPI